MTSIEVKPSLAQGPRTSTHSDRKSTPHVLTPDVDAESAAILAAYENFIPNSEEERSIVRKIDFILLPILWWMYILAYLDRGNIANANAAGLSEDLGLSDDRKST
jgi:hypothetical protein